MSSSRKCIFLVDDDITNLTVGKNAISEKFNVFTIPSGEKLLRMLEKTTPDLILLDVEMPGMSGYEAIEKIKANKATAEIPIIFLTAKGDSGSELKGLSLGATDYISKPFSPPLLLKRLELHLLVRDQRRELEDYNDTLQMKVNEKTKMVYNLQNAILRTIAELVECRDDITGGHIERTQSYLSILVKALIEKNLYEEEISAWNVDFLLQSAQLHDVGKIAIKDRILQKPTKLTAEEFEEMKTHVSFGVKVIERIQSNTNQDALFLEHAKIFAGSHHEKWDGSGYPFGLGGLEIPLQGRLMAIADVYDALISERPYKKPFSHEEAVKIIAAGKGSHFDPVLVDVFLEYEDYFKEAATATAENG